MARTLRLVCLVAIGALAGVPAAATACELWCLEHSPAAVAGASEGASHHHGTERTSAHHPPGHSGSRLSHDARCCSERGYPGLSVTAVPLATRLLTVVDGGVLRSPVPGLASLDLFPALPHVRPPGGAPATRAPLVLRI